MALCVLLTACSPDEYNQVYALKTSIQSIGYHTVPNTAVYIDIEDDNGNWQQWASAMTSSTVFITDDDGVDWYDFATSYWWVPDAWYKIEYDTSYGYCSVKYRIRTANGTIINHLTTNAAGAAVQINHRMIHFNLCTYLII